MVDEFAELFLSAQVETVEVLKRGKETIRALDLPLNLEWALGSNLYVVVKGFEMSCFILKTLILSEFILEMDRQIVHLAFLIENHLQVQLVYILLQAVFIKKIDNFLIIDLSRIHSDCRQIFHSRRLTF